MNGSQPLIAHRQATVAAQPRQGTLDHPTMPSQPLLRLDALAGHAREDAALATGQPTEGVIVGFVSMQFAGAPTWAPSLAAHRRNRIQGGGQLGAIVDIGCCQADGERNACTVDDHMAFAARLAAIGGIGAGRFAPLLAATLAESNEARDQSSLSAA